MSGYKGYTESRKKSNAKYDAESVDRFTVRLPKGKKTLLQLYCAGINQSLNAFILAAIDEKLERDKKD